MKPRLTRISPGGSRISARAIAAVLGQRDPGTQLCAALCERLGATGLSFHRSGREALRVAFDQLARRSARSEIIVPAYCCYSIPAAAACHAPDIPSKASFV